MTEIELDPVGRQVVQHAQTLSQLRRDLDRLASELADTYADVHSRLDELATGRTSVSTPWSWRTIGPNAQEELSTELRRWVRWIRARYPLAKKVPSCWEEHPEVVEELTALWVAWQAAYEERDPSLTAAAEWHDRWLPGLLHRLEHGPFALDCSDSHHSRPASCYAPSDSVTSPQ
ncbi:DUF4913 domain-containing protein [Nocardioides marmorisolisilvae]|uniref:DUF4913 domain-containing protein n=1 Tax=Nocardioides marmorisolisilvae TaxID=1542737 RepID=A0A3N0DQI1_9ACTN|nr:DUF4913 domain-containing protein [Nocardioides marmorisolisilvae]